MHNMSTLNNLNLYLNLNVTHHIKKNFFFSGSLIVNTEAFSKTVSRVKKFQNTGWVKMLTSKLWPHVLSSDAVPFQPTCAYAL